MTNLRYALRNILHHRLYSAINIVGLALSLACTIILAKYIFREVTVNHFITDLDNVYYQTMDDGRHPEMLYGCPTIEINGQRVELANQPGVDVLSWISVSTGSVTITDRKEPVEQVKIVASDSNLLRVVDFPLAVGDARTVLSTPGSAIISPALARRMWGDENPLGRSFRAYDLDFTVQAIAAPISSASSLEFDVIVTSNDPNLERYGGRICLLRLADEGAAERINAMFASNSKSDVFGYAIKWGLRPYADYYFDGINSTFIRDNMYMGSRANVKVLTVVALLLLAIGIFNFINIYTVMLLRRRREFVVNRIFGASAWNLCRLLWAENYVMVGGAVILALAIVGTVADFSSALLGVPVALNWSFDVPLVVTILLLLPIITTIYPWLKYQKMQRMAADSHGHGAVSARAVFMVTQYVISIMLVIGSIFFMIQLRYLINSDLGFNYHDVIRTGLNCPAQEKDESAEEYYARMTRHGEALLSRLDSEPLVDSYAVGMSPLDILGRSVSELRQSGSTDDYTSVVMNEIYVGTDRFFGLRYLDGQYLADTSIRGNISVILNESAARAIGGVKVGDMVELKQSENPFQPDDRKRRVIGVLADFSPQHLSMSTPPIMLNPRRLDIYFGSRFDFFFRPVAGHTAQAVAAIERLYNEFSDGTATFRYSLLEDEIRMRYTDERRTSKVYATFAVIAILISSMGLLGLSLYDVRQRYREIALRRINGATAAQIIAMLLRKYYLMLAVAFVIAVPLAWWGIAAYLADFATRAPLAWWIFAVAALITGAVSLGTLLFQSRRAANANPVKALKVS